MTRKTGRIFINADNLWVGEAVKNHQCLISGLKVSIVFQVFCEMLGKENMSGIAAIHDPLRHINSSPEEIGLIVDIRDWIDRATVNAHAYVKSRMAL